MVKRTIVKTVPFVLMLAIALGSVSISCVTGPRSDQQLDELFVNLGPDEQGRLFTVQTFSRIDRVILIEREDRTRRSEIDPQNWRYDPDTTEIVLDQPLPSRDVAVHVEGAAARPHRFVLGSGGRTIEDLLVIVDGRRAIPGYDYQWNGQDGSVEFRRDLDMTELQYMIRYFTPQGSGSIGNWRPDDRDSLAYLEARHRQEQIQRRLDAPEGLYFLEPADDPEGTPTVVRRPPTEDERARIEAMSASVWKPRHGVDDDAVSREVGFNVRTPEVINLPSLRLTSTGKTIEESMAGGEIRLAVREFYRATQPDSALPSLTVLMAAEPIGYRFDGSERFVISRTELNRGLPITRTVTWGTQTSGDLDAQPAVIRLAEYEWVDDGVSFHVTIPADQATDAENAIGQIVSYRNRSAQ